MVITEALQVRSLKLGRYFAVSATIEKSRDPNFRSRQRYCNKLITPNDECFYFFSYSSLAYVAVPCRNRRLFRTLIFEKNAFKVWCNFSVFYQPLVLA